MSDKTQPETELLLNGVAFNADDRMQSQTEGPCSAGNGDCSSAFS